MTDALSPEVIEKLQTQKVIWFTSVRPEDRPHMAPMWFVWHEDKFYVSTGPNSVKAQNIQRNPQVVIALEDGTNPVICEGSARAISSPAPVPVADAFFRKYEWNLSTEEHFTQLIEVTPEHWVNW